MATKRSQKEDAKVLQAMASEISRITADVPAVPSASIGRIVSLEGLRRACLDFPLNASGDLVPASSLVDLTRTAIGCQVALVFEDGDLARPIILGLLPREQTHSTSDERAQAVEVVRDGERLFLSAGNEIVLRCGRASITLTRAGKVLIQGEYVVSRSTGVNKLRGGSVQIN